MFLLLWFSMIKEKNGTLSMVVVALALLASVKTAFP